jgi:ankyrin repeat protein
MQRLLKAGIDPDAADYDRRSGLHLSAAEGNFPMVKMLVEGDADLMFKDRWGTDALIEAVKNKQTSIAEYLVSKGADVNSKDNDGNTPLYHAVFAKDDNAIAMLVSNKAKFGVENQVATGELICRAGFDGDEEMMERLLRAGADPDSCDYDKRTGLHLASAEGKLGIVKILCEKGATLGFKDRWGTDALIESTKHKQSEVVKYLVACGANVHSKDNEGITAIQHAVIIGAEEAVECLAGAGAFLGEPARIAELLAQAGFNKDPDFLLRLMKADPKVISSFDERAGLHLSIAGGQEFDLSVDVKIVRKN